MLVHGSGGRQHRNESLQRKHKGSVLQMKFPMDWHRTCLKNSEQSLAQTSLEIERANAKHARLLADINEYRDQIAEAERRGVDGFDRDKFGKKRIA